MGRQAVPVRKMVGAMILKQMYNLGDETFVARWIENPYWQYFCGETFFKYDQSSFTKNSISDLSVFWISVVMLMLIVIKSANQKL
jgi:hypothetical protein